MAGSLPAQASDGPTRGRGALTGVGLGFLAVSLAGVGLGIGGSLNSADANRTLTAYVGDGRTPLQSEAITVRELQARAQSGQALAGAGFVLGGVGLAASVLCLVLDGLWADRPVDVAFTPSAGGGALVFSARF